MHLVHKAYPYANFFSLDRWRNGGAILLGTDMRLSQYHPEPMLVVERKAVDRPAFPPIDIHFHLGSLPKDIDAARLVKAMDAAGIAQVVNLDGSKGDFERYAREFRDKYPERFILFVKPNFTEALRDPQGGAKQVQWIDEAVRMGAQGVKVNKSLGLGIRDAQGKLAQIDDPHFDPIWSEAGRLGLPVLIHTGDPPAFYLPANSKNERYEELAEFPEWGRYGKDAPPFKELMAQRERMIARHPETNFIGAHIGSNEDDLVYAASLLDRFPNYYVDMSSRVAALGRQPYTARKFLLKYQDRILFGTDGGYGLKANGPGWTPERYYRSHFEFLETANEYIDYPQGDTLSQGRWRVYGVELPAETLERIYVGNARRLLPNHADLVAKLGK
jgi:predicted TIM-barrel fold metal-dependent hydrolase